MQEEEIQAIKEGFEAKYPQITMNYFFAGTNKVLTLSLIHISEPTRPY